MSAYFDASGWGPRSLGDWSANRQDLLTYLPTDSVRLWPADGEPSSFARFQWNWSEPGSAGFRIDHRAVVWAIQFVGQQEVGPGWVTCRRIETTNPSLTQPDVDFMWSCIRGLPETPDGIREWAGRESLGRIEEYQMLGYNRQYNATLLSLFENQAGLSHRSAGGGALDAADAHTRATQRMHQQAIRLITEAAFNLAVSAGCANNASWTAAGGVGDFAARHGATLPVRRP